MNLTKTIYEAYDITITGVPEVPENATNAGDLQPLADAFGGIAKLAKTAINNVIFHKTLGVARDTLIAALEKKTPMRTKPVLDEATGEPVLVEGVAQTEPDETLKGYVARCKAEGVTLDSPLEIVFDAKTTDRGPAVEKGAGKLATQAAEKKLAEGPDAVKKTVKTLLKLNPGLDLPVDETTGVPTVENFAKAIKTNYDRVQAEAKAALAL